MSDLVERLRQMTGRHDIEAADEIERLRREVVSRNRRALDLTADNAALRELLQAINAAPRHFENGSYLVRLYYDDFERIDAALAPAKDYDEATIKAREQP